MQIQFRSLNSEFHEIQKPGLLQLQNWFYNFEALISCQHKVETAQPVLKMFQKNWSHDSRDFRVPANSVLRHMAFDWTKSFNQSQKLMQIENGVV